MPTEDPRITRSRRTVLRAATRVLAERGYSGFTIDAVARTSGVARSTIYRLWPGRPELINAALESLNVQPRPDIDGATPRESVRALLRHLDEAVNEGPIADCLPALIDGAERDPGLRDLHHAQSRRRRTTLTEIITRVLVEADEDPADADLIAQALSGAVMYARLMSGERLTPAQLERLTERVLGVPR